MEEGPPEGVRACSHQGLGAGNRGAWTAQKISKFKRAPVLVDQQHQPVPRDNDAYQR